MNYDLNEEQNILKEAAHRFLSEECPSEYVRAMVEDPKGYTQELWNKMANMGWMGLMIPEEYEGSGMDFLHLAVLLTEMGYFCLPGPFFSTVVLAGLALMEAGSDAQKRAILPELAAGKRIMTLAWVEENGTYLPEGIKISAELKKDNYVLSGTKLFVPDAHVADTIICAAKTGKGAKAISLFLVDAKSPGVSINLLSTMAGDKQCEVIFDKVKVPKGNLLGKPGKGWEALKRILLMAAVGKSAEMSGGAQRVMEMTVTYVKDREQFGRPVGSFQAIQFYCADMFTFADTIQFITNQAAWRIGAGLPYEKEASMCKAWVSDSYRKLVALGHQSIGGMGFMEEFDLQLYFKRAKAAELMFGDADLHRELVAQEMGL
jgi:alkylation response protein AidB-like acyl-CoA dehydrogenase